MNNNHWICVAGNTNNEVSVYYSIGGNLSQDVFFEEDVEKEPGNFMAECSKCGEWYHRNFKVITKEVFVNPNGIWECNFRR